MVAQGVIHFFEPVEVEKDQRQPGAMPPGSHDRLMHALEQERTSLLDERRAMARRVEEMLVKLSVLEKAVHA
jgi:hypothetical protein